VADFYGEHLGLRPARRPRFVSGDGDPFYHFALLAPGDRFGGLLDWVRGRVDLLPDPETGEEVFDFESWDARACYFHDPAGNIVELIAHRGIGESGAKGPFSGDELLGFSELGLVGDIPAMARELKALGLRLWSGTVDEPGRLAFVGEQARTLILAPPGRGWLPTGRPAEPHPVAVTLTGATDGEAVLDRRHHVTVRAAAA
jgi:hypothetical protein